jgi:hypothetical protein
VTRSPATDALVRLAGTGAVLTLGADGVTVVAPAGLARAMATAARVARLVAAFPGARLVAVDPVADPRLPARLAAAVAAWPTHAWRRCPRCGAEALAPARGQRRCRLTPGCRGLLDPPAYRLALTTGVEVHPA